MIDEAAEALDIEAAAIQATQPDAAAYLERLAHAAGTLRPGARLIRPRKNAAPNRRPREATK